MHPENIDPIPDAPKCGYCGQPATTSNGNCTEHRGRPSAGEWAEAWRVGSKVPINVYEGDRPVCQCHTASDARRIVAAMNSRIEVERNEATPDAQKRAEAEAREWLERQGLGDLSLYWPVREASLEWKARAEAAESQLAALRQQVEKLAAPEPKGGPQ